MMRLFWLLMHSASYSDSRRASEEPGVAGAQAPGAEEGREGGLAGCTGRRRWGVARDVGKQRSEGPLGSL